MKKINEFITDGIVHITDIDTEHLMCLQMCLEIMPGRWEVYVDKDDDDRYSQILLKAKFQEPLPPKGEGSSFFMGGKL